jgi:hypothetical protein
VRFALRAFPAALAVAALLTALSPRGARGVPQYAARTGLMCQSCHFDPNGGGPRNEFGFAFAAHRHALEPEPQGSPFADLTLTNRVSDTFPLYVGINQRFMLLANTQTKTDSLDRLGFFNMENSVHLAFQPHPRLTLVYSFDAFSTGPSNVTRNKEGFGMIGGFPLNGYIKAGRFRTPFGLRLDDHTVATRNGFLDFGDQSSVLPYDPRFPDMGVEVGADRNGFFGRLAYTNGDADVFGGGFAGAKTLKLGYNHPRAQVAASFYDDYRKETFNPVQRATRWGAYGLTHAGPFSALGEVVAGTDEGQPPTPDVVSGPKRNLLAWFGELDYTPVRWFNGRLRYDKLITDRSSDPALRDAATHQRYAVEAEYVPVPFAELRWALRWIDHQDEAAYGFKNETQSYLQLHLSY